MDRKELEESLATILYGVDAKTYGGGDDYLPRKWSEVSDHEKGSYRTQAREVMAYLRYLGLLKI